MSKVLEVWSRCRRWRRRKGERCSETGRLDIDSTKRVRGLLRLALGALIPSMPVGLIILTHLMSTGYLRTFSRPSDKLRRLTPVKVPRFILLVAQFSSPESRVALSTFYANVALLKASLDLRELVVKNDFTKTVGNQLNPASNSLIHERRSTILNNCDNSIAPIVDGRNILRVKNFSLLPDSAEEERFESLISQKRVVVIAGSSSSVVNFTRLEANAHETRVLLKTVDGAKLADGTTLQGDISYFHAHASETFVVEMRKRSTLAPTSPRVPLVVFVNRPPTIHKELAFPYCVHKIQIWMLQGTARLGEKVILDVLRFKPKSVHLVGFDGYLSPPPENPLRASWGGRTTFLRALGSFTQHDFTANRFLLRQWLESGQVTADQTTVNYCAMTDSEFANALDVAIRAQYGIVVS